MAQRWSSLIYNFYYNTDCLYKSSVGDYIAILTIKTNIV